MHIVSISPRASTQRAVPSRTRQVCCCSWLQSCIPDFRDHIPDAPPYLQRPFAFTSKHIQNSTTRPSQRNSLQGRILSSAPDFARQGLTSQTLLQPQTHLLLPTSACPHYPCAPQRTSPLNTRMFLQVQDSSWMA